MFEIDKRIAHLSEDQIDDLMKKYYENVKAKDLVNEYNINITASKLYTIFPPLKCENEICDHCGNPMYQERQSKTKYSWSKPKKFCPNCGHTSDSYCNCEHCQNKRREEQERVRKERDEAIERKKKIINQIYSYSGVDKKTMEELSTREKIYLGALFRAALSEDMSKIEPLNSKELRLAPTLNYSEKIIDELYENGVILVDVNSNIDAFSDDARSFNKFEVGFIVNFSKEQYEDTITSLFVGNYIDIDNEECLEVWRELALEESLEYFQISMQRVNFEFTPGKKTYEVFNQFLEFFSVSQIYQIIYANIAKATKYYQEGNISKRQAANSVITNSQSYCERAVAENWKLKQFYRDRECKESSLSQFLFSRIIKIGDVGFNTKPHINCITENIYN